MGSVCCARPLSETNLHLSSYEKYLVRRESNTLLPRIEYEYFLRAIKKDGFKFDLEAR